MVLAPARQHVLRDVEQIEDARNHEVDQIIDGLRLVIEAGEAGRMVTPRLDSLSMFSR